MSGRKCNKVIEQFIEIYKSEPCLWRLKSKDYHDREKRSTAYEKLVTKLKELEPDATKNSVVKKINNLRSNVRKEKKKHDSSKKSGASTDDLYISKLWYYNLFDFLGNQDTPETQVSNQETTPLSQRKRKRENVSGTEQNVVKYLQQASSAIQSIQNTEIQNGHSQQYPDACTLYGQLIAEKLRQLSTRNRLIVQNQIDNMLFKVLLEVTDDTQHFLQQAEDAIDIDIDIKVGPEVTNQSI